MSSITDSDNASLKVEMWMLGSTRQQQFTEVLLVILLCSPLMISRHDICDLKLELNIYAWKLESKTVLWNTAVNRKIRFHKKISVRFDFEKTVTEISVTAHHYFQVMNTVNICCFKRVSEQKILYIDSSWIYEKILSWQLYFLLLISGELLCSQMAF